MRDEFLEIKVLSVIEVFVKEIYPQLKGKPVPAVICMDDHQFKKTLNVRDTSTGARAAYHIPSNTLYFRNRPDANAIAHEVAHWAQAQTLGPEEYIERNQDLRTYLNFEYEAIAAAKKHASLIAAIM